MDPPTPYKPSEASLADLPPVATRKRISITRVVVLLLIVFGILCAIAIPSYTDAPPSRQAGSYLYSMSLGWQKHVEEHARRTSSLVGSNLGLESPVVEDTKFGRFEMSMDSNGTIKLRNTKFNLEALVTPGLREGSVHWSCKGTPACQGYESVVQITPKTPNISPNKRPRTAPSSCAVAPVWPIRYPANARERPDLALEPTAASALRLLAVPSAPRASAAAQRER